MKSRLLSAVYACAIAFLLRALSLATAALLLSTSALAATFTVDSVMDIADANPGDGVCETAPSSGICTLRAAIQEANGLPWSDRIELPAGTYTIALQGTDEDAGATGDLDVLGDLEISGEASATTIVDAAGLDRILDIFSATVTVTDVTLQNGLAAILGGGIRNNLEGTLTLERVVLTDNTANQGGGLHSLDGSVTINDSLVSNNTAADLDVTNNQGGGIYTRRSMLRITNSTIAGNTALSDAGGAGLYLVDDSTGTIVNTTISGNDRVGMRVQNANAGLFNVTFTENTQFGLSFFTFDDRVVTAANSIIADNAGVDCQGDTVVSAGHNLNTDGTCGFAAPGDLVNTDPLLGGLADNGGFTPTHALLAGSPAIDAGDDLSCSAADQRNLPRPVDGEGHCDIGAYEFQSTGEPQVSSVVAAVLPVSRSVEVGTPATVFASVVNSGADPALRCGIAATTPVPADLSYQTTDPITNALTGSANTPADVPVAGSQSFVVVLDLREAFDSIDVELRFQCANTVPAPVTPGLTTLLLSASDTPIPDIVALAATVGNDGIVNIPGSTGTGFFSVATVNVGAAGAITATADTGDAGMPVTLSLCQTDPGSGECQSAIGPSVSTTIAGGETPTFAVFATSSGTVPFDPANNRIFVRFKDVGAITRGATSVAVRTQ